MCGTTASLCGIEKARQTGDKEAMEKALRLDEMLHAFMFTMSGVPVLYSGDEVAQENDNAYHGDPLKSDDSRYLHRGNMDWEKAELRHDPRTVEGKLFNAIQDLETLRAEHLVFDDAADTWLLNTGNDHILGIGRYYKGEKLLALFNFSDEEQIAWVNDPDEYTDLITGEKTDAKAVTLPAGGFKWLYQE